MPFDWRSFLEREGIHYVEAGKNVARGHVNIACPFCGSADHSQHMGIELSSGAWGCWRSKEHRGRSPARLVAALKGIRLDDAKRMVGAEEERPSTTGDTTRQLLERAHNLDRFPTRTATLHDRIQLPRSFLPIDLHGPRRRFFRHLHSPQRRFSREDVPAVIKRYDLRCCLGGEWGWRILFPIRHRGRLVGWTGRTLADNPGSSILRYKTYPPGPDAKRYLMGYDLASEGGEVLVVVEGPFDYIKVDFYGHRQGIRAVPLLTTSATGAQLNLLLRLANRFDRVVVMTDTGAASQGLQLARELALVRPVVRLLPPGVKDPGLLRPAEVVPAVLGNIAKIGIDYL